jgi:MFS family permease
VLLAALAVIAAVSVRIVRLDGHAEVEAEDLPPDAEVREDSFATDDVPPPVASAGWRAFVPLFLVYGVFVLNGFVYRGSLTFLPTHIEDNLNISWFGLEEAALASSLTTLALLAGSAGQLFGGTLSQRQTLERLAVPMTLALLPSLLLIGVTSGLWMVVFAGAFVFANFSAQPVYTGLIADYSPQQALGRSYGVSFFAAFGIGSLAATFAGFFADRWGTDSVFVVLAGVAGITLLLAVAIWRLAERARAEGQLAAQLR